jgi:hypothetical protein
MVRFLFMALVILGLIGLATMLAFVLREGAHGRQQHESDLVLRTGANSGAISSPALIPALATVPG